ncbi:MAG: hypothetical protein HY902_01630 [Deltaproteobacteria bacterium]|nr:hypothetical protein [Deltaproteobacteria bacterium]
MQTRRARLDRLGLPALVAIALGACRGEPAPRYGQAMHEIGRRFEVLGRAAAAGRYELARYELDELNEVVEHDLPRAQAPQVGDLVGAAASLRDMRLALGRLDADLKHPEPGQVRSSFALTAKACNACHASLAHGFIEIPQELGGTVPRTDAGSLVRDDP